MKHDVIDKIVGAMPPFLLHNTLVDVADKLLDKGGNWTHIADVDKDCKALLDNLVRAGIAEKGEAQALDKSHCIDVYRIRAKS